MLDVYKIENLARENGLSNSFIARKLGKSSSLFVDWKKGKFKPSDADLEMLSFLLRTTPDYLLGKTDIKNRPPELDGLSPEMESIFNRIQRLSPDNLSKLSELIDLYLSSQDNK